MVTAVVTKVLPVFMTNLVRVPATNLVAKPEALATIEATGSVFSLLRLPQFFGFQTYLPAWST